MSTRRAPSGRARKSVGRDFSPTPTAKQKRKPRGSNTNNLNGNTTKTPRRAKKTGNRRKPWEDDEPEEYHYTHYESTSDSSDSDEEDVLSGRSGIHEDLVDEDIDESSIKAEIESIDEDVEKIFCPWIELDSSEIPTLDLPDSSRDIPIDDDHLMDTVEIYEILRSYHRTLRLSPFPFEDFCAALASTDNSCLLSEIHICLLKMSLKNDDEEQIHYSVNDTNNSFNIMVHCLESMTYGEVIRQYLESDSNVPQEVLDAINVPNYPFVDLTTRITVITFLCYRFLYSHEYKKIAMNGGKITNDESCRVCGKTGDLINCQNCEISLHIKCMETGDYAENFTCRLCVQHQQSRGVMDCIPLDQVSSRQPLRMQPLGRDRHGRIYWFAVRRIFVQNEDESLLRYYSTAPQVYELVQHMDPHRFEYQLCKIFCEQLENIMEQMAVTLEMSSDRREGAYQEMYSRNKPLPPDVLLHRDNLSRMAKIISSDAMKLESEVKKEENDDYAYQPLLKRVEGMCGIVGGRLTNNFWSGNLEESEVLAHYRRLMSGEDLFPVPENYFRMGTGDDLALKMYRNLYVTHELGESPNSRKKTADKKKYLSTRFYLAEEGETAFEWSVARGRDMYGNDKLQCKYMEWTLAKLMRKIPEELMHRSWPKECEAFKRALDCVPDFESLRELLLRLECGIRRPVFSMQFWSSLGHTRLIRTTVDQREQQARQLQRRKKEEKEQVTADIDDENVVWVKFSRMKNKINQSLWRMKDEHYRVNGKGMLGGWMWVSRTLLRDHQPLAEMPSLGITAESLPAELTSVANTKAHRLDSIVSKLKVWREVQIQAKLQMLKDDQVVLCSPTCRLAASTADVEIVESTCECVPGDRIVQEDTTEEDTRLVAKAYDTQREVKPKISFGEDIPWPLPKPDRFISKSTNRKTILAIPLAIQRSLARKAGRVALYIPGFSTTAKANQNVWNYPCLRPTFELCWKWLTENAKSLHAVALQLRILWCSIRWGDMEPDDNHPDRRFVVHHADRDEVRSIISHKEFPPLGLYERYLLMIENVPLDDDDIDDDDDEAWSDRKKGGRTSTRKKKNVEKSRIRRETREEWIDGVELKLYEIKDYWKGLLEKAKAAEKTYNQSLITPIRTGIGVKRSATAMITNGASNNYAIANERQKRSAAAIKVRNSDYIYDKAEMDAYEKLEQPYVKRAKMLAGGTSDGFMGRRMAAGHEYDEGILRGGGKIVQQQPVGDGMRRVITSSVAQSIGAEETISTTPGRQVSTPQSGTSSNTTTTTTTTTSNDQPPVIPRYDSTGGSYGAQVLPRVTPPAVQQRPVLLTQSAQQVQRLAAGGNTSQAGPGNMGKVLMIRRSDGTMQFLRMSGEGNQQQVRRVVPGALPVRTNGSRSSSGVVRYDVNPRVVRVGPNGNPLMSGAGIETPPRLVGIGGVSRTALVNPPADPFMKRMAAEKALTGSPAITPAAARTGVRTNPQRSEYSNYYGESSNDNANVDDYSGTERPTGRQTTGRLSWNGFGYTNDSSHRVIPRGGATIQMGHRMAQDGIANRFGFGNQPRKVTSYKEFCMRRGIVDNMRLPSRPFRFEFESNEEEERAIAEAIAREEELMRIEEESKLGILAPESRLESRFALRGGYYNTDISKLPLTYSSNLMPTKDDTSDQKVIKQVLDSIITQVCRWDKQMGWYKSHLKKSKNRADDRINSNFRTRRMFVTQRETIMSEHVDRLRREVNKRRTRLENKAEELCGLLTPWRKARGRPNRMQKRVFSPEPDGSRRVMNPAEISLGGDSVDWTKQSEEMQDDDDDDELVEASPNKRSKRNEDDQFAVADWQSTRKGPAVTTPTKRDNKNDGDSSADEDPSEARTPRRGRPRKDQSMVKDDSVPEGLDPNELHCICQQKYDAKKFYLSCGLCLRWFHGRCVGISERRAKRMDGWNCDDCLQTTHQEQQVYCVCRTPYDDTKFYVGCDGCEGWFHPHCVNITQEAAEACDEYLCPTCSSGEKEENDEEKEAEGYESAASAESEEQPALSRADYPLVWGLLDTITEHRMAWPFLEPVNIQQFPDYLHVIQQPMDLSTIQQKLERLEYHQLKHFARDMVLMFENAKQYNSKDKPIYLCAETLEKIFSHHLAVVQIEIDARIAQGRKMSECRTIDSSLDIDTDQLIDVDVDPSMYENLI